MPLKRVVITGLGTINPLGNNVEEYFSNLDKGVSGASLIDRFDTTLFKTKFAFSEDEKAEINIALDKANDMMKEYIVNTFDKFMNRFN